MDIGTIDVQRLGIWINEPDRRVREEFNRYMKTSYFPEMFPGIARGFRPPRGRSFRIIRRGISIDPVKRDGIYVPCNLCGPSPKFLNDGILIIDEYGWLYLIGPICALQYYEGRFTQELNRFRSEEAKDAATEFLLEMVPKTPILAKYAQNLLPFASSAQGFHAAIQRTGQIARLFRVAFNKQDGWLRGQEPVTAVRRNGAKQTKFHTVNISHIDGKIAAQTKYTLSTKLNQAISFLALFGNDEESATEFAAQAENSEGLIRTESSLRRSLDGLRLVRDGLVGFQQFASKKNIKSIAQYSQDRRVTFRFSVREERETIIFREHDEFSVSVPLGCLRLELPNIPTELGEVLG